MHSGAKAMQATPLFIGACVLASIGGIVSGATINTQPLQRGGIGLEEINRPALAFDPSDSGLSDQVALPDHYALKTPEGRFEVAELSNRGLYAQRRFGWRDAVWTPPQEYAFVDDPEPMVPDWSQTRVEGPAPPAPPTPVEPAAESTQQIGQAHIIDVASALAAQ
jgi:hypothetical protein